MATGVRGSVEARATSQKESPPRNEGPLARARRVYLDPRLKEVIVLLAIGAFVLQAYRVLLSAYPIMITGGGAGSNYALDFGVYYDAAWRMVHAPAQLYSSGNFPGDWPFVVPPTDFKYLPFFSFFMLPFLLLDYTSALLAWNGLQLLLMPVMGFLLYRALKSYNILVILGVIWVVLLQPLPIPPAFATTLYGLYHSQSYYWQWAEGQAKVFITFLIVASYYFSRDRKPYIAGLFFGLAFFDPRIPLYALPLFLIANWGQYKKFTFATIATLAVGDAVLLYDGLGASFIAMVQSTGLSTPYYQYVWIPIYTLAALTVVEGAGWIYRNWRSGTFRRTIGSARNGQMGQASKAT